MRTKDIVVGVDYAWQQGDNYRAERVRVIETGLVRKVYDARSFRPRPGPSDGVNIQFYGYGEKAGELVDRFDVVPASQIKRTWAEQEPIIEARAQRRAAEENVGAEMRELAAKLKQHLGVTWGVNASYRREDGVANGLDLNIEAARKLAELLGL